MSTDDYELIDSGCGRKLERFGRYVVARPCAQALWRQKLPANQWSRADASFDRADGNRWNGRSNLPREWNVKIADIAFRLSGTDFGHLGIFPEQRAQWRWIRKTLSSFCSQGRKASVLNLFAYSGGSTMASALGGAEVCHLDASKGMVEWARANAALNSLTTHPIRWIVDDAHVFMRREIRRGRRYDAIILDPPTFGRGAKGEMYKIERDLEETLSLVKSLLSDNPLFVLFSSHTPGLSVHVAENIISQAFNPVTIESGEMLLEGGGFSCPSGVYCRAIFR
jgi:23S rRNA (cytosine1962-C5)-methyltransferase